MRKFYFAFVLSVLGLVNVSAQLSITGSPCCMGELGTYLVYPSNLQGTDQYVIEVPGFLIDVDLDNGPSGPGSPHYESYWSGVATVSFHKTHLLIDLEDTSNEPVPVLLPVQKWYSMGAYFGDREHTAAAQCFYVIYLEYQQ